MGKTKEANLREGNISLVIDSYNDLFSDFDPRPSSERALSDDFLLECKKAAEVKEIGLELRMLVPVAKRKIFEESVIKKRLKYYFQKHFKEKENEIKKIKSEGLLWFLLGSVIMLITTALYNYPGFFFHFLFVIGQPAGWFTFWEGLGKIFITAKEKIPEYEFYKKMNSARIIFLSY